MLRHLVNQDAVVLLMATLGVSDLLDGFGQTIWGSDIYRIDTGLPKTPLLVAEKIFEGGILINTEDLVAAAIAALLVLALALFFQKTPTGRALRAVADDHQAAQSIGIPLSRIWVIVWTVAGVVALVAGMIWGSKLGVQFSLALIALKALPVVILGGFTSVPGAILGGLIIGVGEKFAEVFLGPVLVKQFDLAGGGIENWFAYVLALLFLLVRPEGLFGETHRPGLNGRQRRCSIAKTASSRSRTQETSRSCRSCRTAGSCSALLAFAYLVMPAIGTEYLILSLVVPFLILTIAAMGLNILVGYCGQISLGPQPSWRSEPTRRTTSLSACPLSISCSCWCCQEGSLRWWACCSHSQPAHQGSLLAVATLAAQFSVDWLFARVKWFTNYSSSGSVSTAPIEMFGWSIETPAQKYLFVLTIDQL